MSNRGEGAATSTPIRQFLVNRGFEAGDAWSIAKLREEAAAYLSAADDEELQGEEAR
jgi:hypothetical protein